MLRVHNVLYELGWMQDHSDRAGVRLPPARRVVG